jgi:uncharacterized membrane protein YciS (DUF1049 family)
MIYTFSLFIGLLIGHIIGLIIFGVYYNYQIRKRKEKAIKRFEEYEERQAKNG